MFKRSVQRGQNGKLVWTRGICATVVFNGEPEFVTTPDARMGSKFKHDNVKSTRYGKCRANAVKWNPGTRISKPTARSNFSHHIDFWPRIHPKNLKNARIFGTRSKF